MIIYCPRCTSEAISITKVTPERVSINELPVGHSRLETYKAQCLSCGYKRMYVAYPEHNDYVIHLMEGS